MHKLQAHDFNNPNGKSSTIITLNFSNVNFDVT